MALPVIAVGLLAGCGGDGGVPLYPASGQVLVNGQPAAGVEVRLHPADRPGDLDAPRPFAVTRENGSFELGTFAEGDGAPAGRYLVSLVWPEEPARREPPEDRLNWAYSDPHKSALRATIAEGETALEPFRVAFGEEPRVRATTRPRNAGRPGPDG